jgi:hypothetical protein
MVLKRIIGAIVGTGVADKTGRMELGGLVQAHRGPIPSQSRDRAAIPVTLPGPYPATIGFTPARSSRRTRIITMVTIRASSAMADESRKPLEKPTDRACA